MIDNDGNITTAGSFGLMAIVMAPLFLVIALLKLFFRAPLAAILGTGFCSGAIWILVLIASGFMSDVNPLAGVFVGFIFVCIGAGMCYGLMSAGWMQRFFAWECHVLRVALARGGMLGRGFYVFVQILPGLLLAAVLAATTREALSSSSAQSPSQADTVILLLILAWLGISQFVVYRFHRTEHPIGMFVSFTGHIYEDPAERGMTVVD